MIRHKQSTGEDGDLMCLTLYLLVQFLCEERLNHDAGVGLVEC